MAAKQYFPLAPSQYNLRRLLAIRLIVFVCQLLALAYVYYALQLALNYFLLGSTLLALALINIITLARLRQNWAVSDAEFLGHLLVDVIGLSILLYLSGGANNPFVSYLLVPVTISAAILPWAYTWVITAISLACYSILLFFYQALPALMPMDMNMGQAGNTPNLHIIGMWCNFLVSAILITFFVVKMAQEIRSKEGRLTRYREDNLRDEQIIALATQAAGTAHELGTPLSTVAVLLSEMEQDYATNEPLQQDILLMKQQVLRCKETLKELVSQADFKNPERSKEIALREFIEQVLSQWQLLRPEVVLVFNIDNADAESAPMVSVEATLQQAIVNMLNNAADASLKGIDVNLSWSEKADKNDSYWQLNIRDYGAGISDEIAEQLGSKVVSTKHGGLGVGHILSQASINRLGGKVSMYQHQEQGMVTEISVPFAKPQVSVNE